MTEAEEEANSARRAGRARSRAGPWQEPPRHPSPRPERGSADLSETPSKQQIDAELREILRTSGFSDDEIDAELAGPARGDLNVAAERLLLERFGPAE